MAAAPTRCTGLRRSNRADDAEHSETSDRPTNAATATAPASTEAPTAECAATTKAPALRQLNEFFFFACARAG